MIEEKHWGRLLGYIDVRGVDECWPWVGPRLMFRGYGKFNCGTQKDLRAHRVVFEVFVRPLEVGELVLHSCDNPPCCNPRHLSGGTSSQNIKEAFARGRKFSPSLDPAVRVKIGLANKGKVRTVEMNMRQSRRMLGHKQSVETVAKRTLKLKGQKRSESFKAHMSAVSKGVPKSFAHRNALSASWARRAPLHQSTVRQFAFGFINTTE